jgi:hypothetical protein
MTPTTINAAAVVVLPGGLLFRHGRAYAPGDTLQTTPADAASLVKLGAARWPR